MSKSLLLFVVGVALLCAVVCFTLGMSATDELRCQHMLDRSHNATDSATVYRLDQWCVPNAK